MQISPDGHALVIEALRADWAANRFRNDLWLYRDKNGGSLVQLTQSGHDRAPFEHAYMLGGVPWEAESNYNAEAPIWQIGKVTTPTHIVAGSEDVNVPVLEDYLLERALQARGVPHRLLIFPGEGHELDKNPWYGKIKVREELKWLEKYGRKSR